MRQLLLLNGQPLGFFFVVEEGLLDRIAGQRKLGILNLLAKAPGPVHQGQGPQVVLTPRLEVIGSKAGGQMNQTGSLFGADKIPHHHPVRIPFEGSCIGQQGFVAQILQGRALDLAPNLQGILVGIGLQSIQSQQKPLLFGSVGVGTAHQNIINGSAHRQTGIGRQGPWRGGPGQGVDLQIQPVEKGPPLVSIAKLQILEQGLGRIGGQPKLGHHRKVLDLTIGPRLI